MLEVYSRAGLVRDRWALRTEQKHKFLVRKLRVLCGCFISDHLTAEYQGRGFYERVEGGVT